MTINKSKNDKTMKLTRHPLIIYQFSLLSISFIIKCENDESFFLYMSLRNFRVHYKYWFMNLQHILNFTYTPSNVYKNKHIKLEKDILFLTNI